MLSVVVRHDSLPLGFGVGGRIGAGESVTMAGSYPIEATDAVELSSASPGHTTDSRLWGNVWNATSYGIGTRNANADHGLDSQGSPTVTVVVLDRSSSANSSPQSRCNRPDR